MMRSAATAADRPAGGVKARLLIAEDEPQIREILVRGLVASGYAVTAVDNGRAALERLADDDPYDLLLTDIVMPELDGIALALTAAQDYPTLRILMMTGYAAERQRAHNLDALSHAVIAKPFALSDMITVIEKALTKPASR